MTIKANFIYKPLKYIFLIYMSKFSLVSLENKIKKERFRGIKKSKKRISKNRCRTG